MNFTSISPPTFFFYASWQGIRILVLFSWGKNARCCIVLYNDSVSLALYGIDLKGKLINPSQTISSTRISESNLVKDTGRPSHTSINFDSFMLLCVRNCKNCKDAFMGFRGLLWSGWGHSCEKANDRKRVPFGEVRTGCLFLNTNWLHLQPLKRTPPWSDMGSLRCLLSKEVAHSGYLRKYTYF